MLGSDIHGFTIHCLSLIHCFDYEQQNEDYLFYFVELKSIKNIWKELFISTNDFAFLYQPSENIFELFFPFQLFRPIHSSPRSCSMTKQRKHKKEATGVIVFYQKLAEDYKSEIKKQGKALRIEYLWYSEGFL